MLDIALHVLTGFVVSVLVFSGIWIGIVQTTDTGQRVGGIIAAIGSGVAGYYGGWRWGWLCAAGAYLLGTIVGALIRMPFKQKPE